MQKVTACPLVICPERLKFYSLSDHCQACAASVARKRERAASAARHARVISGTGDSGERRELAALIRGLRA
ncbi:MAG: hypothetical protein NTZ61_09600 [Proteobacteria bacterium]|nr:hypothetical protein [Pseudomonadota bacterium]